MPRLTLSYFKIPLLAPATNLEAARKSGDVSKGDVVTITGFNDKGQISVDLPSGQPSEHWHKLDAFYPNKASAANDNG